MNVNTLARFKRTSLGLCLVLVGGVVSTAQVAAGTTTNAPGKPADTSVVIAKSIFVTPRNKSEGRDPFHPASTHPYDQPIPKGATRSTAPTVDLVLKAIGGPPGNRIATINTRNFAKGEDGEMNTSGGRIQIHIVDIQDDLVIVTVNGEQRELRFRRQFQ